MKDEELLNMMKKEVVDKVQGYSKDPTHTSQTTLAPQQEPVVAEIPITSGQLHRIAAGNYCQIGQKGEPFAVRFLLKNSFKLRNKDFVVRNIVMQVVAVGKDNVMRKEDIATDIRIKKSSKTVKDKEKVDFQVQKESKELF